MNGNAGGLRKGNAVLFQQRNRNRSLPILPEIGALVGKLRAGARAHSADTLFLTPQIIRLCHQAHHRQLVAFVDHIGQIQHLGCQLSRLYGYGADHRSACQMNGACVGNGAGSGDGAVGGVIHLSFTGKGHIHPATLINSLRRQGFRSHRHLCATCVPLCRCGCGQTQESAVAMGSAIGDVCHQRRDYNSICDHTVLA